MREKEELDHPFVAPPTALGGPAPRILNNPLYIICIRRLFGVVSQFLPFGAHMGKERTALDLNMTGACHPMMLRGMEGERRLND